MKPADIGVTSDALQCILALVTARHYGTEIDVEDLIAGHDLRGLLGAALALLAGYIDLSPDPPEQFRHFAEGINAAVLAAERGDGPIS